MEFTRYAIYYAPPAAPAWVQFATAWLGWDMHTGQDAAPLHLPDLPVALSEITASPRKYGLHGTIKPPFRLAQGYLPHDLEAACAELCRSLSPVSLGQLRLTRMGRFLALCPENSPGTIPATSLALKTLAGSCVQKLDRFRAPATAKEMDKRRMRRLTARQEGNLKNWGYPYVLDDFRFHLTLSGRLKKPDLNHAEATLKARLEPLLPKETILGDLALAGEGPDGQFHLIRRFDLAFDLPAG